MSMQTAEQEVLHTCIEWLEAGHSVDLVTVAKTWGSSPRPPGSLAAIRDDNKLVGSVSGGCVEKQLAEQFRDTHINQAHKHHIDDQQARQFGLACGGQLELVFEQLNDATELKQIVQALTQRKRVVRRTYLGKSYSELSDAQADDRFSYNEKTLSNVFGPSWQVLLIGAGQLSRFVAEFALALDFDVLVCDPRPEFYKQWQVNGCKLLTIEPHEAVIQHAQDERSAVLALTHDPNLDDMALLEALPSQAFYVGALGSKRNYQRRCERLSNLLEPAELERLYSPVGLAIGSRSSAEIGVSIAAQLCQVRAETLALNASTNRVT